MRVHILGIGGTFMSGLALLAKQLGHQVTGSDDGLYPPMSIQLADQKIHVSKYTDLSCLDNKLDVVIVGNVIKRGNPGMEYILSQRIPFISGPQWLYEQILKDRWVLAVSGTHGKTTTSSLLAWILDHAGLTPGFLIGGIPENFGVSARLGNGPYFVIEADEYDSAFFDKRSKFIHYRPQTLILNNLEYDHADIFPDLTSIKQQFHYLIRTIPNNGLLIHPAQDKELADVLEMGCWTPKTTFGTPKKHSSSRSSSDQPDWQARLAKEDGSLFQVIYQGDFIGEVSWNLLGIHNVNNALAALAAATHIGLAKETAMRALTDFKNVKRRLEVKGKIKEITIYDDFAHHPTAIATTLSGLRAKVGDGARIIAVLEFGSYTMRKGVHKNQIQTALEKADMVICKNTDSDWGLKTILAQFKQPTAIYDEVENLVTHLVPKLMANDHVVVMSNSSFGGIHQKLIAALETV